MLDRISVMCACLAVVSLLPRAGAASPVETFFSAEPFQCGNATMIADWRVAGDTDTDIVIEAYQRRSDRDGSNFEGQSWSVPASSLGDLLDLSDANGRAVWRVSGLLDNQPVVLALARRGEVRTDCAITFQIVDSARARFDVILALFDTAEPTPNEAIRVNPAKASQPPLGLLPELERSATQVALQEKYSAFWERYRLTSLNRADDPEDADLIEGLDRVLIADERRQPRQWNADLMTEVLERRAAAIQNANGDPKDEALSASVFCDRLTALPRYYDWSKYLLTATGVPITSWDEGFAQNHLDMAASCDAGRSFTETVTRRWPEVQMINAGSAELDAEIERLANEPINLAAAKAENWYELNRETLEKYRGFGLNDQVVRAALEPALEQRRNAAAPILGEEMAAGSESQPFAEMPEWCTTQSRALQEGYRTSTLLQEVTGTCETIVATAWRAAGLEILETRRQEIEALDDSTENLFRNNFFEVEVPRPNNVRVSAVFQAVFAELTTAAASMSASFDPKRRAGIDAGLLEIETVFAEAGPLDPENRATDFCSGVVNNFDPRVVELRNACINGLNILNAAKQQAQCDEVWADVPAPDGFREGRISTPFDVSAIEVNALICNREFQNSGMQIVDDSGFFSSEYLLVNERVIGGTPVRFEAVLTEPATESGEWTLTDAKLNDAALDGPTYKTSADFMRCGFFIEECFRQN